MALDADQLSDFQADLGITDDQAVFTDTELNRLYTRADEDYALAVYFAYRQLLAQANKYHNYTAGMAREELNQVRQNIKDSMLHWKSEARSAANQIQSISLLSVPPHDKDFPTGGDINADSGFLVR